MLKRIALAHKPDKRTATLPFHLNNENLFHYLYQQSVTSIIEQRLLLEIAPDTVFLAI